MVVGMTTPTWDEFHEERSGIVAEMIGAANYLDANPEYATDEVLAATFRRYVERLRAVERPA